MVYAINTLIVGAGPAGLQLAQHLGEAGVERLVLEASTAPGGFFRAFPRHRTLISINKVHVGKDPGDPLRYDWNSLLGLPGSPRFTDYTDRYLPPADDMVRYLADYTAHHRLPVRYGERCVRIGRVGDQFEVVTQVGSTYLAERVVVATGVSRPRIPELPGIEHAESYFDFDPNPERFRDARVLIIGKGNSAFETASSLLESAATIHMCSPNPVRFAWATHYVGHLRAVNNDFLDTYLLKSQNAVLDAEVTAIRPAGAGYEVDLAYTHAGGHRVTYSYDRIIACTGFRFDDSMFAPGVRPELRHDGRLPAMTSGYESTTVPGLYFAGTLMQSRDFKKTMSGFIHGFRYNVQFLASLVADGGRLSPRSRLSVDPAGLAEHALWRLNTSDAMFLQPGYLADVYSHDVRSGETVTSGKAVGNVGSLGYYPGIPLDYLRDGQLGNGPHYALTLEYGPPAANPFQVERRNSPDYADETPFLHPVLRHIHRGDEIARCNLLEDLENRFSAEEYLPLLHKFFQTELTPAAVEEEI